MVVNLYSTATKMWAIKVTNIGDISSWGTGSNSACSATRNGVVCRNTGTFTRPSGTPLNKIDFGTTSAITLYANSFLRSYIALSWYAPATPPGYKAINLHGATSGSNPGFDCSSGDWWSYLSDAYLATAIINGSTKLGILVYSNNPNAYGQAMFCYSDGWSEDFLSEVKFIDDSNPYYGGGYSGPGGGDPEKQNWAGNSDLVAPDALPDEAHYGAQACGLITIFSPTDTQLKYLADVIWGNGFFQFMQNLVENISDLFISFGMVPFTVPTSGSVEVTWFDYVLSGHQVGTGIYLNKATQQLLEFDMGTILLDGSDDRIFTSDSVLDYSPYSRLGIYLPFIGYQELDIDECRGSALNLKYRIDILSGTVVAQISLSGRTIYQFTGNCLTQLPLTSVDAQTVISNAVNIGIAAASAGTSGAVASAGDAFTAEKVAAGDISAAKGALENSQHSASVSNAQGTLAAATANGMMGMKPSFKKSGAIGASASLISVMQPYLFLTTPRQSMPENYNTCCGFPTNMGGTLGSFKGFTVVEDIRLNNLVATSPEVEEIYKLLKSGVII